MSRAKRLYVPKTKGCHQCSQRRINCDKKEPGCDKCVAKGLECSGYGGQRFRFRNGFGLKKKSVTATTNQPVRRLDMSTSLPGDDQVPDRGSDIEVLAKEPLSAASSSQELQQNEATDPSAFSVISLDSGLTDSPSALNLDHISPWKRYLVKHFSDHIAPEMVVIDDSSNGWRHLVLPLACADELVMSAVLAVSAFHLSERSLLEQIVDPTRLYSKAINELQKRSDLHDFDADSRHRIIMTIILLLLATMVNGSSDFPIIFRMLQSALEMIGGDTGLLETGDVIADFSADQIRRMRVYASPFISQDAGVSAIGTGGQQGWADQEQYLISYPNQSYTLSLISSLRELAFQIYLQRASTTTVATMHPLATFRLLLESFPDTIPGEHMLIWPVFIAAAASHTQNDRVFFSGILQKHFCRSGFVNIRKALESLRRIWARSSDQDWTTMLPEQAVLVM